MDVTDLKIYDESKWKTRKHYKEKLHIWRKLHLAVDVSTHAVIAAEVSLVYVGDNEVLPILRNPFRRKIQQVSADGTYDTRACHYVLKNQGITPSIPP
ncbi:Mobile element protein [Candidatus Enterovibrio escicola]|uniref:Mobile element protein n=1 Tax=Candidatus Enterovibrio escicola TaxID=1927127 RepID=A0A2A5T807_9GAMM|nr:Mobile element protein [Candidatus Enterovibrio escacola]